jgi:hypothetical protein
VARSKDERFGTVAATINAQSVGPLPRAIADWSPRETEDRTSKTAGTGVRSGPGVYRDGRDPGRLYNYRLNPPASRVTALAGQAPRRSARGLAVRSADIP